MFNKGQYLDSETRNNKYIINLIKTWHCITVYPDDVFESPLSLELSEAADKMNTWCDGNCSDQWTTVWVNYITPTYLYCFKQIEDAVLFSLVWARTYHTRNNK